MTKKRINKSKLNQTTDSTLKHCDSSNLDSRPLDSSLRTSASLRMTESEADSHAKNINHILNLFYQISQIPHPSGQTKDLQKFLVDFLESCKCEIQTDSAGNIHALKGTPHIIFQAHYDMVLVGQKIAPFVENGFLKSRDSSLGADNGIAVATLLHFAKTRENIEILLTNDEEIGMVGAKNLNLQTHSKTMINLDSECVNEICVGCAGGFDADIALDSPLHFCHCEAREAQRSNSKNTAFYELQAHNFKGGHSGIDIDKNIPNAIVELLWALESLREKCKFEIVEICGGEARNAIPINARAVIAVNVAKQGKAEVFLVNSVDCHDLPLANLAMTHNNAKSRHCEAHEVQRSNPNHTNLNKTKINAPKENIDLSKKLPHITIKKLESYSIDSRPNPLPSAIIPHLLRLHNGIYAIENGSVTSSLNFSLISNESLKIMIRANSAELLRRHETRLKALFGANVALSGFYSAWEREPSGNSAILARLQELYAKHRISHKIVQIHAGLECGVLKQKCDLREVVSIGPTILHPHSKNEALDLESVGKIYDILCDLMPT